MSAGATRHSVLMEQSVIGVVKQGKSSMQISKTVIMNAPKAKFERRMTTANASFCINALA